MAKFYAVKEGKKTGIYHTWDECKEQVNGYSGAVYKSFTNEEEAKAFIKKEEKKKFGPLAYYFKGMTQLPQQLSTNLHLNVTVDNESFEEDAYMFAITNTNRVGGFDGIIPFADINDGKLDLLIVKRCSITDLIALIKDYRFGKHDKSPFIHYIQGQHIHITCDQDLTMDIDGEEGTHLPIDVHTLQKSIQLLVPLK